MRTLFVPRGMPPIAPPVLECLGCTHAPHDPGHCAQLTLFTRERCSCTYRRDQVRER